MTSMADVPVYMLPGVPVVQPPHLEGLSDPSLSTEILPGPPSLLSVQQAAHKRDPKKPGAFVSYLPASDPGSTYSGLMASTFSGTDAEGQRRKRARVDKGTANGRAQRASARNMNSSAIPPSDLMVPEVSSRQPSIPPVPDSDPFPINPDFDEPSVSRATSAPALDEPLPPQPPPPLVSNGRGRPRKDKGKGKETEKSSVKIKEEPMTSFSLSPDPSLGLLNEDHCSSCRSLGALVYCDGCPRAFHLWCLDPPMETVDLPELGEKWYCPSCTIRKHPPLKPPPSFISPLIHQAQTNIPKEFQLPDDVRNFFKDVATGSNGCYIDNSEIKQPRLNRHGQLEEREPYRLKDKNGVPVLCFRCGTSALPSAVDVSAPPAKRPRRSTSSSHSATPEVWRSMVSCDYCSLHWHLDCVDPPLVTMPPFNKKWMCPNHADHALQSKRRVPKQNPSMIDITKPRQFNNGNIDIVHPQGTSIAEKLVLDEILINGRRYRVPEKVIMLDFWNKLSRDQHFDQRPPVSAMSSPLTSLSSLDDFDENIGTLSEGPLISRDELHAAQALCNFQQMLNKQSEQRHTPIVNPRKLVDSSTQTEAELPPIIPLPPQVEVLRASTNKRKAPTKSAAPALENGSGVKSSVPSPADQSAPVRPKRARIAVKQEVEEVTLRVPDKPEKQPEAQGKSTRTTRQRRKPRPSDTAKDEGASMTNAQTITPASSSMVRSVGPEASDLHGASALPAPNPPKVNAPITPKASVTITQSSQSSTPTLKIRLPRLSAVSAAVHSNAAPPATGPVRTAAGAKEPRPKRSLRRQTSDSATVSLSGTSPSATDGGDEFEPTKLKRKPSKSGRKVRE
ncbi:uncharacterized protein EDB91DRAFT_1111661 [Suillus paluster]|uniref:uncharacterized protein n=1 Tax=Suillus paluster TaxID=48578 RepID=UPI001B86759F|nr:uncharacterized protein EDB91DRAFT_1111661 [Suillus paluster]KAG1748959.1 hypothetical protein EDB91DRAFT_1111661 [Suillus paluster]